MFNDMLALGANGGGRTPHKITYRQWHTVEDSTTIYRQVWIDGDSSNPILDDTMPSVTNQGRIFDQTVDALVDGVTYNIRSYSTSTGSTYFNLQLLCGDLSATIFTRSSGTSVNLSQRYDVQTDFIV